MTKPDDPHSIDTQNEDAHLIALGYRPQFRRVLSLFADFSLGYSYMGALAGVFGLFAFALTTSGPPFFWTMVVVVVGQGLVCLVFAEAASAFPIAGGVYQWSRRLAGVRWGFLTAWIYLLALIATAAGIAASGAPFLAELLGAASTPTFNAFAGIAIALVAIFANVGGTRILSRVTEIGVWTGLLGLLICGGYMLFFARVQPVSILWNSFGLAKGNYAPELLAASLIGIWIFYGFEACGDLAEEVDNASRAVPRAMLLTIICGGSSALLMTIGLLFAIPNITAAINGTVADPAGAAVLQALGPTGMKLTVVLVLVAIICSTASVLASTSRLFFSLARDEMIVGAKFLTVIDQRRDIPTVAVWTTSVLTILILCVGFISSNAATQIISFATAGIYTAFQMVVLASLVASLKGWHSNGSFRLGATGIPVKVVALVFGVGAILNLVWPRTPASGWFANWLVLISLLVIIGLGLIQMLVRNMHSARISIPE